MNAEKTEDDGKATAESANVQEQASAKQDNPDETRFLSRMKGAAQFLFL